MAKNKSFTGGRKSVGTPTLNKTAYFQLIRQIRNAKEGVNNGQRVRRRTHDN